MGELDSLIQEARDAISDLEAALANVDDSDYPQSEYDEARDWAQQLEGRALDIIDILNNLID